MRPDLDREFEVIGTYFAGRLAIRQAERVREIIDKWQPDLLVCDDMDFGAMIAAEHAGVARIVVNVIASGALTRIEHVQHPLAKLREIYGLPDDPNLMQLARDLVIAPGPSSFRDPNFPLPPDAISVRSETGPARTDVDHPAVMWLAGGYEAHRVYVTLGTIFNTESGDLFVRVLQGLRDLPVRVLATVGQAIDPASIPVAADNIRIEHFVPQAAVLEHCDLVVNHAGSGSVLGALANGVPLITLPMGADQELNAERLTQLGAGITLDPITVSSADICEATNAALVSMICGLRQNVCSAKTVNSHLCRQSLTRFSPRSNPLQLQARVRRTWSPDPDADHLYRVSHSVSGNLDLICVKGEHLPTSGSGNESNSVVRCRTSRSRIGARARFQFQSGSLEEIDSATVRMAGRAGCVLDGRTVALRRSAPSLRCGSSSWKRI